MKLYDEVITSWIGLIPADAVKLTVDPQVHWNDLGNDNMIFRSDMAYELGGGRCFQKSAVAITDSHTLVPEDEILLIGPDLPEISADRDFARLSIVRVNDTRLGEGESLYQAIRKIEFTKYHVSPEGYMLRITSGSSAESARVSKQGLQKGLNFSIVGNMYLRKFHEDPNVEAVRQIFITADTFPFDQLLPEIRRAADITSAIDHIFKDMSVMDCKACSLQRVCEEVEGLREMHFHSGASTEKQESK